MQFFGRGSTHSTGSLPFNAATVTINGFGFDPNAGNNTVAFNLGAVGVVTAATDASLTVTFSTPPTSLGTLTAIVTSDGYQAAGAVQVATVVPAVPPSTTPLTVYSTSLTISGSGFDASTPANNTVALALQGTSIPATVTAATSTSLTITCSPPSSLTGTSGILTAVVTTDGYSSGSTQVVTVTPTDENGNLLTSGASNLTPYLSIDWTWSIVVHNRSLGSFGPITYNASTGSYEQTFYPNWTLYTNSIFPGDSAFFTFYGYFDGQTGGTLNGNIRCYVYMYETR